VNDQRRAGPIISASELGEYSYCRRAWWLSRVQGLPSANVRALAQGQARHEGHGLRAQRSIRLRKVALCGLTIAIISVAAGILLLLHEFMGGIV